MIDPNPPKPTTHTVAAGETLGAIASQYEKTLEEVLALNKDITDPNLIQVGQVITIVDPTADIEYTVVEGDTVSGLAERFGRNWTEIAVANKLEDVNLILVGQKLTIPGKSFLR